MGSERIERVEVRQMSLRQDDTRPLPDHTQAYSQLVVRLLPSVATSRVTPANISSQRSVEEVTFRNAAKWLHKPNELIPSRNESSAYEWLMPLRTGSPENRCLACDLTHSRVRVLLVAMAQLVQLDDTVRSLTAEPNT